MNEASLRGETDPVSRAAQAAPEKCAATDLASGRRFSYGELDDRIARFASILIQMLGQSSGARVAMLSRNRTDVLTVQFAAIRAGAIFVPMNWRLAAAELRVLALDCLPRLVVHEAEFADLAQVVAEEASCETLALDAPFEAMLQRAERAPAQAIVADAPATLLYTSGTTGRPKGVIVTERNAAATAENFAALAHVDANSVFLCEPPLFHVVGLYAICRSALGAGATLLFSDRFDPAKTWRWLSDPEMAVTHYMCVPQMAQALRSAPGFDGRKLARLTAFSTGGAPHPKPLILPWLDDGVALADGYGMSETGTVLSMPPRAPDQLRAKAGSAGKLAHLVEARIARADGSEAAADEVGELWVRGPNISPGYWNNPDATAASREGGWFRSGDLARRDADGFFFLVDRAKDMFISGGENIYPAEVEAALLDIPGVAEASVFGVADPRWGEIGCAYIVQAKGAALDEATVFAALRERLAGYKIPKQIVFASALPRTASGKVQKHVLKAEHAANPDQKA